MTNKHTPGPWFEDTHINGNQYVYPKLGLNPICQVFDGYKDNAHLIAAAPDLLAACEMSLNHMTGMPKETRPNSLIEIVSAAIKKARGES